MSEKPLYEFTSHIEGKNAKVAIWPDRVEWSKTSLSAAKTLTGVGFFTGFTNKDTNMMPMRMISAVQTKKGLTNTLVTLVGAGNSLEMKVSHKEAETIRQVVNQQLLAR